MSQTDTITAPAAAPARSTTSLLLTLLINFLAPMFQCLTGGDLDRAEVAAAEAIGDYLARNHTDLLAVALIIGFDLAAMGSLSQSMEKDISPSMALRLRGNARALHRVAERDRHARLPAEEATWHEAREPVRRERVARESVLPEPVAEIAADESPEQDGLLSSADAAAMLARESEARLMRPAEKPAAGPAAGSAVRAPTGAGRDQDMWAEAMTKRAADLEKSLPGLTPEARKSAQIQITALRSSAHELLSTGRLSRPIGGF